LAAHFYKTLDTEPVRIMPNFVARRVMKVNPIPPGYRTVTPYVTVADAHAEIEFLKRAFGAQTTEALSQEPDGTIRHAELKIGDSMLMLGQARDQWTPRRTGFYLYVEDCDAWYKRAMAAGAKSLMEPADQFYGDRKCGRRRSGGKLLVDRNASGSCVA
jgi:uncharacterized glyoxalase superfamily protein PhnB